MTRSPRISSIFVGQPKTITDSRGSWTSSILRDQVDAPVELRPEGIVGDRVTQPYHGGADSALCVHLLDHYRYWKESYGISLPEGAMGENFTLADISENEICAGDIVRAGSALVQVSGPRIPCENLARRLGRADWPRLAIRENRTGFYARVLEAGIARPGDAWDLRDRLNPEGSITSLNRCFYLDFDPDFARAAGEMRGLGDWWKDQFLQKLHDYSSRSSETTQA
ncbi:MAG TPA: MOSC domain-containing protein [Verrucomicrobiae bacterium]|nr:MOSC domain-containing protein [Verrucomicrobiae bacterium]